MITISQYLSGSASSIMIPTKTILNIGVFIFLVVSPLSVNAVMVKYEEPFPPRLPVHVKSRVAFSQYANVPMLSLEEIKNGFPWLEMSAESGSNREDTHRSTESGPRYIFYYVPTEVALQSSGSGVKSHPVYDDPKSEPSGRQNSFRDRSRNHRFQSDTNKSTQSPKERTKRTKHASKNRKRNEKFVDLNAKPSPTESAEDLVEEKRKYERPRDRHSDDQEGGERKSKVKKSLPQDRKLRARDYPVRGSYRYPKVPSPYMQPPKLRFEEKEFWVKNKRKSKRPIEESATNEERLKNHRIVKQKKSKEVNPENEKRLRNHRPTYDREHDPEEHAESSSGKVEKLHKRPKEKPKNPLLLSQDGERIEFQIHGHEGPQTYIFGFDTGDGVNRHFRLEERLRDGSVKGHYGYYDSNGKLKMVEYKSRPMGGFEEKHHEGSAHRTDQEDDDKTKS